jgi:hypothetical protein
MKLKLALSAALAALAVPAMAQVVVDPAPAVVVDVPPAVVVDVPPAVVVDVPPAYRAEPIYVPAIRPSGAIHGGAVTLEDERLLGDAVSALASDRTLDNMTITMVAKNGELIVNGVAKDVAQAARIERNLKNVAGGRVSSRFTTQTG